MTSRIFPMTSSHLLIFEILQYWTMGSHNLSLRTSINILMTHCFKTPILMHMENPITELPKPLIAPSVTNLLYLLGSLSLMFTCMRPRHLKISDWTHQKGRINHMIRHLMCLFMIDPILPILMNLTTPHPCPLSFLMTYWGEPPSYLWMRMGRGRGLPFLSMSMISIKHKSQEKISSDSSSRLMETNLMTSFHITNLWNTSRTGQTLVHWKVDFTDSNPSKITKDHILPQTQHTMEVVTTYLLRGRMGSKHGKQRITTSGRKLLFMTRNTSPRDTRRLEYTLYLMSMDISRRNLWKLSPQECSLQSPLTWNYGEQMLDMHTTFKHLQGRK